VTASRATWASPTPPHRPARCGFQAPGPVIPWEGVREATVFGPTPPKPRYREPFATLLYEPDDVPGSN
jgi:para-nitrobenzyl esterase